MPTRQTHRRQNFGLEKVALAGGLILCLIMITASDFGDQDLNAAPSIGVTVSSLDHDVQRQGAAMRP